MTRFRHDLILRLVKIMDAVLVTIPFALCWYLYYAKHIASPFYAKGDYLVVALFFVLFIMFGRVYDAFLMSMYRISEIVYAQFLAAAVSDFIMYVVIWLLSKHLPNILPGVAALVGQLVLAAVWARSAHHAYFKTFPPRATAVIYDTRQGLESIPRSVRMWTSWLVRSFWTATMSLICRACITFKRNFKLRRAYGNEGKMG